jgi:dienelactone hydrolase
MQSNEVVRFASRNPDDFKDILSGERWAAQPSVPLAGFLRLPQSMAGAVPLVIISIGSGGFGSGREALYSDVFACSGVATLAVDSFGARGFSETRSDQGLISFATSCADAICALQAMSSDTRIDPERIGLLGYSRGGGAVLMTDHERLQGAIVGPGPRFAAYMALYPSVWLRWKHPQPTRGPIFVAPAANDDMAPPARVRARTDALAEAGAAVETCIIPEVGHSFDAVYPAAYKPESNRSEWDIVVDDDGSMQETVTGIVQDAGWPAFLQQIGRVHEKRGGTTGNGPLPRTVAVDPLMRFVQRALIGRDSAR